MNVFRGFRSQIVDVLGELAEAGEFPTGLDVSRISAEPPRDPSHGDLSTNAAMVLAKPASMKPRDLAEVLTKGMLGLASVEHAEVAGPGFINVRFSAAFWQDQLKTVLDQGIEYGQSDIGQGQRVNVEYVSANPTGPLHVAHARGAVVGDALVNLLRKAGFDVTSEYYINDAGAQVDQLGRSAHLRYREALGEYIGEVPEGLYPGE
ncbi:arginine--tRNA ligase, partial [Rhodospirillales bacterium]|nr:arginine--tRNA ligase [Rhodospirillales bacterium]